MQRRNKMLKFKEYLNEEASLETVDVDTRYLSNNLEQMNADLEVLTAKPYQNAPIFLSQLRGFFERYGMLLPASATQQFLDLNAELVYQLGDSGLHLYIVYDTNDDGYVDGYAQAVTADELDDLVGSNGSSVLNKDRNLIAVQHSDWYRKRDDDAGNSDEY